MGRKAVLAGFWLLGFCLGFFGYLLFPALAETAKIFPETLASEAVIGAFIAGLIGSLVTTVTVTVWSYLSR